MRSPRPTRSSPRPRRRSSRACSPRTLPAARRCLVAHPVNPPHLVPIVELVGAPWTAPETVARAKTGLRVDRPGADRRAPRDRGLHPQPAAGRAAGRSVPARRRRLRLAAGPRQDASRTASACAGRSWGRSPPSSSTRPAASPTTARAIPASTNACSRSRPAPTSTRSRTSRRILEEWGEHAFGRAAGRTHPLARRAACGFAGAQEDAAGRARLIVS